MSNVIRFLVLSSLTLLIDSSLHALQAHADCKSREYEHHNQIDYALNVASLRGTAKDIHDVPIFRGCVGIFTESDKKLVVATETDGEGRFQVSGLPNGKHRLVASSEGFCAANAVAVLKNRHRGKKNLAVTMRTSAIDVCSYIELK